MKQILSLFLLSLCLLVTACGQQKAAAPENDIRVIIKTDNGDIHATIYASKTPITAANFLNLAKRGFYNDVKFHRVIPNFMIQGGDPTETGGGNPGYNFQDEFHPSLRHSQAGILSMANRGPGTNGCQFFITHAKTPHLDDLHTVFGQVTKGQDVVDSIVGKNSGPGFLTDGIGNKILSIEILDSTDELFKLQENQINAWNKMLDQRYPVKE